MDNATKTYREKATAFIKGMGKGYGFEKETRQEQKKQWAAWEAYFLTTLGKLPLEMENFLMGRTKGVTVPTEYPEAFDVEYVPGPIDERTPRQRRYAAARLCNCEMGRRAHDGGWLPGLIEFAERHDRLPAGLEIDGVRAVGKRARKQLKKCEGGDWYPAVVKLRRAMLEKAHLEVFGTPGTISEDVCPLYVPPPAKRVSGRYTPVETIAERAKKFTDELTAQVAAGRSPLAEAGKKQDAAE